MILEVYRFISTILVLLGMMKFTFSLLKVKNKIKVQTILVIIVCYSAIYTITYNIIPQELMSVVSIIYFFIVLKMLLKLSVEKTIFYVLIVWLIGVACDVLLMIVTNIILSIDAENNVIINHMKLHATIIMAFLYFICSKFNYLIVKINNIYKKIGKINYPLLKIIFILILFCLFDMVCVNYMNEQEIPIMIFLSLILVVIILVNIIIQNYQIISLKETNDILSRNIDFYIKRIDEYRIMKHNLKSKLNGLKTVSGKRAYPYINEIIQEYNEGIAIPSNIMCVPKGLNGIIYEKVYEFNNKDIKITIENNLNREILKILTPKNYNLLCEVLGITLDNALEAAAKSKNKIVYLKFSDLKENVKITIMNSFSGTIDLDELGQINYSSKNSGHGLGLFSIISKKDLKLTTNIKNKLFINEIIISKIK